MFYLFHLEQLQKQPEIIIAPIVPNEKIVSTMDVSQFKVVEHTDGSKEFLLSALRNFKEKYSFTFFWFIFGGIIVGLYFISSKFDELPAWISFFTIGQVKGALWEILVPVQLLLTYAVFNMWLRSNRIFVRPNEIRIVTYWIFLKKTQIAPLSEIIEIRPENNTSDGGILYFDIIVVVIAPKSRWLGIDKDSKTGGRRIVAATNIKGKEEAERFLQEINKVLLSSESTTEETN